jgi:hypothetical protein
LICDIISINNELFLFTNYVTYNNHVITNVSCQRYKRLTIRFNIENLWKTLLIIIHSLQKKTQRFVYSNFNKKYYKWYFTRRIFWCAECCCFSVWCSMCWKTFSFRHSNIFSKDIVPRDISSWHEKSNDVNIRSGRPFLWHSLLVCERYLFSFFFPFSWT